MQGEHKHRQQQVDGGAPQLRPRGVRLQFEVLLGQDDLEGRSDGGDEHLHAVQVQAEQVRRIQQDAGECFVTVAVRGHPQALLQREVEARQVHGQDLFAGFLGAKDAAQGAHRLRPPRLVPVDCQAVVRALQLTCFIQTRRLGNIQIQVQVEASFCVID